MTVIAWDGKTMAADKQGELYCTKVLRTKIRRIGVSVVGCSGDGHVGEAICKWIELGAGNDSFPKTTTDSKTNVLLASPNGLFLYCESSPHPIRIDNKFFAIGAGCDAAMAAMHLGCNAKTAVEVACEICVGCGNGVDVLETDWVGLL